MRRCVVEWGWLILLAAALPALYAGCRSASSPTGSLAGTVRDAATNDPIVGAEVTVGAAYTRTEAGGKFTLEDLDLGERSATVTAPGYRTLKKSITIEAGDNTVVFELLPQEAIDGGLPQDAPLQFDAQRDAAQNDAATCSGNSCTYGYAYGGCCAAYPYCANYNGASSLICRSNCGGTNERCGYHSDCCNGSCVSGYCAAPSCAGNSCTYGYYYGGCCAEAQYCVNYNGASSLVCRATCGNTNERCAYASDCCSNNCVSGYCAAASCAGNTCTYGYVDYGGCCSTAQYCTNPNGYSYMSCRSTCGNTNERCYSNGDCCSGLTCSSGYCVAASCAGNTCTYGYVDYGGCCSTAPYCTNPNGYSYMSCRSTCGNTNERCYSNGDCCSNSCVSGYCAASCAGNSCTAGYANGGCCAGQRYCVNSYGSSTLYCRATCGATYERCAYNGDCCNGTCAYNSTYGQVLCN